jgi:hypothetical protein
MTTEGQEASVDELKAALKPFALMVMQLSKSLDDEEIVIMALKPPAPAVTDTDPWASSVYTPPFPVTVGDVRRAAYLLGLLRKLEGRIDSERAPK